MSKLNLWCRKQFLDAPNMRSILDWKYPKYPKAHQSNVLKCISISFTPSKCGNLVLTWRVSCIGDILKPIKYYNPILLEHWRKWNILESTQELILYGQCDLKVFFPLGGKCCNVLVQQCEIFHQAQKEIGCIECKCKDNNRLVSPWEAPSVSKIR